MISGNRNKLFGTDGIRAKFGEFPIDLPALRCLGASLSSLWKGKKILLGRDTRESGSAIERTLTSRMAEGVEIHSLGVVPTPGLAYLTAHSGYDYGIMITASHNPFHDNGIKIFRSNGEKISIEEEGQIEKAFYAGLESGLSRENGGQGKPEPVIFSRESDEYIRFLREQTRGLDNLKLTCIVDCAQGATFEMAPLILAETGLEVIPIHDRPDGRNINQQSGSTDLNPLKARVKSEKAHLCIAFDGDGDRVIFVDGQGYELNGDYALVLIADLLLKTQPDFNRTVVGTVMSNLGLELALKQRGIDLIRTGVGDRMVFQEMKNRGAVLGGEQSGHVIVRTYSPTGDGILTALLFLRAIATLNRDVPDLKNLISPQPQVIRNIRVRQKPDLQSWEELNRLTGEFRKRHGHHSRLVIRYSGTEPKIRVMMESRHESVIQDNINKFVDLIRSRIGD